MKVGIALVVPYARMREVTEAAEEAGFESVWAPEHLVLPATMSGSPHPGEDSPPMPADTPVLDVLMVLASLGHATARIRLGTWVYNLALRHPLVAARGVQTLDVLSGGRALLGVGAGWLREEYEAAGVDFASRGARLDECIEAARALWTHDVVTFAGAHVTIPPVRFEPKPPQGSVPILVGGESPAALRRAARLGDGWLGMRHDVAGARARVERLAALAAGYGRAPVPVTIGATPTTRDELDAYAAAGVERVIAVPWQRSRDAIPALQACARTLGLG